MSFGGEIDYGCENEDHEEKGSIRLKSDIDLADLVSGKAVELEIDDSSFNLENKIDETSNVYEENEVYKTSELYFLGENESEDNDDDDDLTQFDRLRNRMQPLTNTDGKVVKRILREGMGATIEEFIIQKSQEELDKPESERRQFEPDDINVAYHYTINSELSPEPFDNSYLRSDRPVRTYLNANLMPGHRYAMLSMREKEVADFLVHPDLAFGAMGVPPRIPPNSTLRYKIELKQFWASTELDHYLKMNRDEKREIPVRKLVKLCSQQREEANKIFTSQDYKGANYLYDKAIKILEDANLKNDEDESKQQRALLKLYLNKAMVALRLGKYDQTITYSDKVLNIEPRNVKALYRKAQAKMKFGDFGKAKTLALQAHTIAPKDQSIGSLLKEIESEERRQKDIEKQLYSRMFQLKVQPQNNKSLHMPSDLRGRISQLVEAFISSKEVEMRLNATIYTDVELAAFQELSRSYNLAALPNKEGDRWISLRLLKE